MSQGSEETKVQNTKHSRPLLYALSLSLILFVYIFMLRDGGLEPFAPFPRTLFGGLPIVLVLVLSPVLALF